MTVISGGVAFSAVKSIDVENAYNKDSEDSEDLQKPLGTPMMMQVSMVTTVVRPMSSAEFEIAKLVFKQSMSDLKDLYKKGKDFYKDNEETFKRAKLAFKAMQGIGDIVSGVKKFLPEEEDPMVKMLAELEANVKALSEKLTDNFAEMKTFISEQTFFTNIMSPTSVLTRHMRDCISHPGDSTKKNFSDAYKNMKPLRMQYQLNAFLNQRTTNPLTLSMDLEKVKTKETFEKWEDIICRVMAQFMLIEAFAGGLLEMKSNSNFDRMLDASIEVLNNMNTWKEEYKKDQAYWADLNSFLKPYMEKRTDLNNYQKAEEIGKRLNNYLTSDAFYMCIFNEAKWQDQYTYFCKNEKEQMVGVWGGKAKCNIFIYRSRRAHTATQDHYQSLRNKVIQCGDGKLRWNGTLENMIKNQLIEPKLVPDNGFIALVNKNVDPRVSYFNYLEPDWLNKGPGHTASVLMDLGSDKREMQMILSFP